MSSDTVISEASAAEARVEVPTRGMVDHSAPAVRIENLGKCYQLFKRPADRLKHSLLKHFKSYATEFWALSGVNLEIARGETVGIIGRNGSGKSTLLQILCGTLTPSVGRVETRGRVAALLELGAGFHPEFTGRENVYLNARIMGLSRQQTDERFDRIAGFADIGDFIDRPVKTYSSGMYVRLAFSVIANVDADILVVDEALAVGDAFFTQKCMRFLRQFRETGTVIFVSHDSAAVLSLCQRALWLEKGKPKMLGAARAVNEAYLAAFFGELNKTRSEEKEPAPTVERESKIDRLSESEDPGLPSGAQLDEPPVTPIHPKSESFGEGGAQILAVDVLNVSTNTATLMADADQPVAVRIHFRATQNLKSPIVGFYLKDRLGQNLFGRTTDPAHAQPMNPNDERIARFSFRMPALQAGQYALAVAVADGTMENHIQHHWVHDATVLTSSGQGAVVGALVGVPMRVSIESTTPPANPPEALHG